tara:strand:- start:118 stop:525 length:408 start_codon:yes stop_codon:yes gene_type:complete
MRVLTTSTSDQTIKIAARRDVVGTINLEVINKSTRKTESYSSSIEWQLYAVNPENADVNWESGGFTSSQGNIFLEITNQYALKEGNYYTLKLIDDNGELYRDVVYCTDQTDYDKYNPNKNKYTQESSFDDSYIIL